MGSRNGLCRGDSFYFREAGLQILVRNADTDMREAIENVYRQQGRERSGLESHTQGLQ